jgi:acetyl esterase/lipase
LKKPVLFVAVVAMIFLISMTGCGTRTVTPASVQSESEQTAQVENAESTDVQTITSKGRDKEEVNHNNMTQEETQISANSVTENTTVSEIINDPVFKDFGRLLFPVDRTVTEDMTLADISSSNVYVWYSDIKKEKTVEIVNDLKSRAENGETIFYPIYSEREMASDPSKKDTGLFFFKGEPGAKFAVMNAGGGFMYVGAMHDSFPHALEVSKKGYNAFALIYRPDDPYTDLAQAIAFIYNNAKELEVDPEGYSLWGGSAGARMAAALGNGDSMAAYERPDIPQAAAVIMQYTGYSAASGKDAPTYACVGTNDGIASWRTMQSRLKTLDSYGIPTEFHAYEGLSHGFGLGTGTVADGWINDAVAFWEHQR